MPSNHGVDLSIPAFVKFVHWFLLLLMYGLLLFDNPPMAPFMDIFPVLVLKDWARFSYKCQYINDQSPNPKQETHRQTLLDTIMADGTLVPPWVKSAHNIMELHNRGQHPRLKTSFTISRAPLTFFFLKTKTTSVISKHNQIRNTTWRDKIPHRKDKERTSLTPLS